MKCIYFAPILVVFCAMLICKTTGKQQLLQDLAAVNWNRCIKSVACDVNNQENTDAVPVPELLPNHVWMFSFGANVGSKVFQSTGVKVKHTVPAVLTNHCLKFNSRVGDKKNVFANIIPSAKSNAMVKLLKRKHNDLRRKNRKCVHGVVHMIEKSDLESIFDKREQCHVRKQVAVKTYSGKSIPNVEVYYGNNGKQHKENFTLKPEVRYLKLIYCGAAERKLNTKYLDKLKEVLLKTSKTDRHDDNVLDCKSLSVLKTPNVDKTEATKTVNDM
eukprot:g3972.t1